jgi:hypothetical protein
MVPQKMDRLFDGCGKQDESPHGDRYKRTSLNDSRHDYGNHSPSHSKCSSLPTQCYVSSSTKRTATLGSNDSRDDDVSLSESDTSDDDDSSYRDKTSDNESNYQDSKFNGVPFRIKWTYKDRTPDDGTKYKGKNGNDLSFLIERTC